MHCKKLKVDGEAEACSWAKLSLANSLGPGLVFLAESKQEP